MSRSELQVEVQCDVAPGDVEERPHHCEANGMFELPGDPRQWRYDLDTMVTQAMEKDGWGHVVVHAKAGEEPEELDLCPRCLAVYYESAAAQTEEPPTSKRKRKHIPRAAPKADPS
jgi:hypothetical protein